VRKPRNESNAEFDDGAVFEDFKKWCKKLGSNQVAAGEMLGLSRGAVQYWKKIRPMPRAVELGCKELLRLWKQ
jgi:hypothetical protein